VEQLPALISNKLLQITIWSQIVNRTRIETHLEKIMELIVQHSLHVYKDMPYINVYSQEKNYLHDLKKLNLPEATKEILEWQ
jgi:hypothetical protein